MAIVQCLRTELTDIKTEKGEGSQEIRQHLGREKHSVSFFIDASWPFENSCHFLPLFLIFSIYRALLFNYWVKRYLLITLPGALPDGNCVNVRHLSVRELGLEFSRTSRWIFHVKSFHLKIWMMSGYAITEIDIFEMRDTFQVLCFCNDLWQNGVHRRDIFDLFVSFHLVFPHFDSRNQRKETGRWSCW